ncbi:MAG: hypothetical protein HDQ93_04980 [Desulfovibrio sp.]|nr:hypothetical protein [Desulfovibrio sp.]
MKKIPLIILCALLCACAARSPRTQIEDPAALWTAMGDAPSLSGPERTQLSLRFGEEGDTRRVTAILWSNDPAELRMDIMAGAGALVALIYDGPGNFLMYVPQDKRAYVYKGSAKPLLRIGTPLPFSLDRLSSLLSGRYAAVFGPDYDSAEITDSGAVFELPDKASLTLDAEGLPVAWAQGNGGWKMTLDYGENRLPKTIRFDNSQGKMAILLVKGRETLAEPFSEEQMSLKLPEGTETLPLSQYGRG